MTKNIIIGILFLTSLFFVVYANIKASEAEKQTLLVLNIAEENQAKARAEEQKAVEAAAKARIMERKAEELQAQLDDCK